MHICFVLSGSKNSSLGLNSDLKYKRTINICISERKWQFKISILAIGVASKHMKDSLKIIKMTLGLSLVQHMLLNNAISEIFTVADRICI